ncbi:hypothetical protein ACFU6K_14885, partial [Kitasatospora sp. NPDC057512]|uniref:hypothetical protein n=1 Tax=Kitasatospora sp. NPDC057512 TaxID=3346154 RepID=UPI0036BBA9D6
MTRPLLVPVEVEALLVNDDIRTTEPFQRWQPDFYNNLGNHHDPEPEPFDTVDDLDTGVYLQWQLPEALRSGHAEPGAADVTFPLVPNRWLVVRYARPTGQPDTDPTVTGWIVDSDFNDGGTGDGTSPYLDPSSASPQPVWIGRSVNLADGPWAEPAGREMFLTAVGCGLPTFSTYQPYNENVLSFRDTLGDLPGPTADLSYAVVGWYSDPAKDIVTGTGTGLAARLAELGWSLTDAPQAVSRSLYVGHVPGLAWDNRPNAVRPPSGRPTDYTVDVALGHTAADATSALPTTGDPVDHQLWTALQYGLLDTLDISQAAFDQAAHAAWFGPSPPGYTWEITGTAALPAEDRARQEAWLAQLNEDQLALDTTARELIALQRRLYGLWWLRGLPADEQPDGFAAACAPELDPTRADGLAGQVSALRDRIAALPPVPTGATAQELQDAIRAYAADHGLPDGCRLKRVAPAPYYQVPDPSIVLRNTGNRRRVTRDTPLPCRTPDQLITALSIAGRSVPAPATPPAPDLTGLPETDTLTRVLAESALLARAAVTPATDPGTYATALAEDLAAPDRLITGTVAEYTAPWSQPWTPLYLLWEVRLYPLPFRTDDTDNWAFDGTRYRWQGTNAAPAYDVLRGRSILTALPAFNAAARLAHHAERHPDAPVEALRRLRDGAADLDLVSQTLDGLNDWFLHRHTTVDLPPEAPLGDLTGAPHTPVPNPGPPDGSESRFQPVRAGQLHLTNVKLVDTFGRACDVVTTTEQQYEQLRPFLAWSVTPDQGRIASPDGDPPAYCVAELPPRLLQPARLTFAPDRPDPAVCGWLLATHLNRADRSLLAYSDQGEGLGELRLTLAPDHSPQVSWQPLPGSPLPDLDADAFAVAHPELAGFLRTLRDRGPASFTAMLDVLDDTLGALAPAAGLQPENSLADLAGRPLALIRSRLRFDLDGPPLTSADWDQVLRPGTAEYPDYRWNIRLGDPDLPTDGLVGFFTQDDYGLFHTHGAPADPDPYLTPVTGNELRLPARPFTEPDSDDNSTHVVLIADPWLAVHARTDILPVVTLQLPDDIVRTALTRMRVAFRVAALPAA